MKNQKQVDDYIYDLKSIIGSGFSSKVYLARHIPSARQVALKVIELSSLTNDIEKMLLKNQVTAMSTLSHPNIVYCEKVLQTANNIYFVMQYCQGGDLGSQLKEGKLNEEECLKKFTQIAEGYGAVARAGFIHRDLKINNIFLKGNVPKIGDFGFSQIINSQKPAQFYNVGSPAYMSPEAYFDTKYSSKSDVWALGVILLQMLTGNKLINKDYPSFLQSYKKEGLSRFQSELSKRALKILSGCLQVSVQLRLDYVQLLQMLKQPSSEVRQILGQLSLNRGLPKVNTLKQIKSVVPQAELNFKQNLKAQLVLLDELQVSIGWINDCYYKSYVPLLFTKLLNIKLRDNDRLIQRNSLKDFATNDVLQHLELVKRANTLIATLPKTNDNQIFNMFLASFVQFSHKNTQEISRIVIKRALGQVQQEGKEWRGLQRVWRLVQVQDHNNL